MKDQFVMLAIEIFMFFVISLVINNIFQNSVSLDILALSAIGFGIGIFIVKKMLR